MPRFPPPDRHRTVLAAALSSPAGRAWTTALGAALAWAASSTGYFWLEPLLGAQVGYNDAPLVYALYYGLWTGAVALAFRARYFTWISRRSPPQDWRLAIPLFALFAGFAALGLPRLPEAEWIYPGEPEEIVLATSVYFLPKSFEIAFQQVLVAALVLALCELGPSMRRLSFATAAMFGGFHLSLALYGYHGFFVLRYTLAATVFGAMLPTLMLRTRSGFLIAYGLHWGYYAFDVTLARYFLGSFLPG